MNEVNSGSEVFRQQVRMAAVQVAGLRPDELAQALAYEAEPLSGIPAPEAEVTYQPVVDADPTVRVYDVVVRRRTGRRGMSNHADRFLRPAYVVAALIVLALLADGIMMNMRRTALEKTVNERRPLQMHLDRLQMDASTARSAAATLRTNREAAVRAQDEAAALRSAHVDLLDELADVCGRGTVLTSIASSDDAHGLRIRGIGASAEAAAGAMQTLSAHVSTNGWCLLPGEMIESDTGATISFSFELTRMR